MQYVGNVIRPPSEADSIILQVTVGCSYNKCTFCGAYKDVRFALKDEEAIRQDLLFARRYCRNANRLFLADGDVLILSQKRLIRLFLLIREHLPRINRISLYGNARAIRGKSAAQLSELKSLGLSRVYMGLESGCDLVLGSIDKGETAKSQCAAAASIRQAGIFLSITALLGLGGVSLSERHAVETGKVLAAMAPHQIAVLTLIPLENTQLGRDVLSGKFVLPGPDLILQELYLLLYQLTGIRCQFHANHASTYLPLAGRLPKDRDELLKRIQQAMNGAVALVPEQRRAL
ncbi:MAG: radical SAM protein [Desulfobulbaceae bacterium BRH_c16a]|nr:MAG: radical SAM protein [Desulfobulbaceae bacterium BRH_c16a]